MKSIKWFILLVLFVAGSGNNAQAISQGENVKVIPVGKGPDALFLTPDEKFLYVANVEDSFISVIDTHRDQVVQTIDGTDYPWGFTRLNGTNLVAVSGWDKGIDIIDFTTHKIVRSKKFEVNLGGITSTHDGKTLFVVATNTNKVLKIDARSLEVLDEYPTGNGPDGVGISGDDTKLYVTNTKDGTISIITIKTKKSHVIKTGGKPELIHSNKDRSRLFISNFFLNKVHILDTHTDKIVKEITGLDGPEEAVLSKSEQILFVVNFNNSKVYTYNANTYEKLPMEFQVGKKPIGIVSAANDSKIYVSNYGDNSVMVISNLNLSKARAMQTRTQKGPKILVKFKDTPQASQIQALEKQLGLKKVKVIPELRLVTFVVTGNRSLDEVLKACQKISYVEYAEPSQKYSIERNNSR